MTRPMARYQTEAGFQASVVQLAELSGWKVAHFRGVKVATVDGIRHMTPVAAGGKGFPDLVLVRDRVVFAELKSQTGRLAREQRAWIDQLSVAGAEVYVWRPSDWREIEAVLARQKEHTP